MYRKILIGGVTAAAIVGAGGTALALTGSDAPAPSSSSSSSSSGKTGDQQHKHGDHRGRRGKGGKLLRHLAHGQFVTTGKDGKSVTHDVIRGTVTAASASSITVQAADKKRETFAVTKDTKIRERTGGKNADGDKSDKSDKSKTKSSATMADIAKGDQVIVLGTGTSKYVAKHIVEFHKK